MNKIYTRINQLANAREGVLYNKRHIINSSRIAKAGTLLVLRDLPAWKNRHSKKGGKKN